MTACGSGAHLDDVKMSRLKVAERQFRQGLLAIKDNRVEDAVSHFCMCLETRVDIYGADAFEVASAYYKYGAALLYSVQDSTNVLGGNLQTAANQHDEQDVAESIVEPPSAAEHVQSTAEDTAVAEVEEATSEAGATHSDIQLAWENLEMAKRIYASQGAACAMELADVVMLLGDLSAEDDAFDRALPDYQQALALLKSLPQDRAAPVQRVAELHFKASLALQFLNRIPEAMTETREAIALCKDRLSALRKMDAAAAAPAANPEPGSAAAAAAATSSQTLQSASATEHKTGAPAAMACAEEQHSGEPLHSSSITGSEAAMPKQSAIEAEAVQLRESLEGLQAAYSSAMAAAGAKGAKPANGSKTPQALDPATCNAVDTKPAPVIQDLGVVGRGGKRRLTPVPIPPSAHATPTISSLARSEAHCTHQTAKKRNLEQIGARVTDDANANVSEL